MAMGGPDGGGNWMDALPQPKMEVGDADWMNGADLHSLEYGKSNPMGSAHMLLGDPSHLGDDLSFDDFHADSLFDFGDLDTHGGQGGLGGHGLEGASAYPLRFLLRFLNFNSLPSPEQDTHLLLDGKALTILSMMIPL
jgi:hypothetical protein